MTGPQGTGTGPGTANEPRTTDAGGTVTQTGTTTGTTTGTVPGEKGAAERATSARVGDERAGVPGGSDPGPGWGAVNRDDAGSPTTVLPTGAAARRAAPPRPAPVRPAPRATGTAAAATAARPILSRSRRARLSVRRIDPWSVFLFSLVASVFLGIALVVAVAVLYTVVDRLGVTTSLNQLFAEVTGGSATTDPLLNAGRIVGGTAVLAAVNVVFLTLLATLGSLLYNLCASFTGGIELTLGERE